jgi:hypothetical protein
MSRQDTRELNAGIIRARHIVLNGTEVSALGIADITATAAELNYNYNVVAGTVAASKTVVVDASKQITELGVTGALTVTKTGSLAMGTLSSANDTSGVALTATKNKAAGIHADTGGAALTAGNIRAALSRFLIGTAISSGADISTYGHEALLKMIASVNVGGNQGGVLGHLESAGTLTLTGGINVVKAGVASFLDLATGATVAAGTVVSAFGVNPANFGTLTGRASSTSPTQWRERGAPSWTSQPQPG